MHRWRFFLQELTDGHWVSVARGPPENIVDAWREFTGTLQEPDIPGAKFQVGSLCIDRHEDYHVFTRNPHQCA